MPESRAENTVELHLQERVARLRLAAPPGRPFTLDHRVLDLLEARLQELESQLEAVALLVVESTSPKYFCVGANIAALRETTAETIVPWVMHGHRVLNRLEDMPCPTLALVRGYALGGGLELALACDLIWATEAASFGQTEARLGFVPGWGGTHRLPRRIGLPAALEMAFAGEILPASEAVRLGLAKVFSSDAELESAVERLAGSVKAGAPTAIARIKRLMRNPGSREAAAAEEAWESQGCLRDPETLRRLDAFLNKRNA